MQYRDYYAILGVARDASAEQIKKAYRQLARKYHPDVSKERDAAARMSEVNEAYAVLSDARRRAAYDALGPGHRSGEAFTPPPGWDAGFEFSGAQPFEGGDFSDFFAELFGRMGGSRRAPGTGGASAAHWAPGGRGHPLRGDDHHAKVVLELRDAIGGATRQIHLRSPQLDAAGRPTMAERVLEVKIPPGVRPGQTIRLAGQGGPGEAGAAAGDLFLEVQLRPDARFRVVGADLVADLPVAPWEAALGAVVPVELPDGSALKVRVPAHAQGGQTLSARGRGLPGTPPGNLDLVLRIVLPSSHDPRARALYERMAAELADFDARRVARAAAERAER